MGSDLLLLSQWRGAHRSLAHSRRVTRMRLGKRLRVAHAVKQRSSHSGATRENAAGESSAVSAGDRGAGDRGAGRAPRRRLRAGGCVWEAVHLSKLA